MPLLTNLALAAGVLDISGTTDCPSPEEISQKLSEIVVLSEGRSLDENARVERDGPNVEVVLESGTGAVVATRTFRAEGTCADLASASAVVLASWLGDAYPELLPSMSEHLEPPPPLPAPKPAPAPITPAKSAKSVPPAPPPRAASQNEHRFTASAGLGASVSSAGATPIAAFGSSWIGPGPSLGMFAAAALSGVQEQPLASGVVRWSRWPLMAGPVLRMASGRLRADLAAGGTVAWLRIDGQDFPSNESASDVSYGAFASVKVSGGPRFLEPFLALNGIVWAKRATATLSTSPSSRLDLPTAEFWLLGGIAIEP